jgi:hypothetical protein
MTRVGSLVVVVTLLSTAIAPYYFDNKATSAVVS